MNSDKASMRMFEKVWSVRELEDIKRKGVVSKNLSDFCDLFHWTNVVKFTTCLTKIHISLIEFISTNKRHLLKKHSLHEKCPYTEFFLARIFSAFGLNMGKYRPEKTPYLDTSHSDLLVKPVLVITIKWLQHLSN